LTLGIVYGVVTPMFEAPDEPQHFWFVKYLADGGGLPVQGASGKATWAQEGSQPPLYYAIAALLVSGIDTDDMDQLLWRNPHANMGVPLMEGNKNVYIHTDRERFPYRGTALAVHLVRLLSTFMGAGTVLATYSIMRLVFPRQPAIAAGAAALNAFTPQFIFIGAAVNNDNAVILLSSWTLWALVRLWTRPFTWRVGFGLGILLGLAPLAKLSGLGLVPLLWLTLLLLWRWGRPWRVLLSIGAVASTVMVALAGWWFMRNLRLYGDFAGLGAMLDVFGWRKAAPSIAGLLGEAEGLRISYWAIFGWFNILSVPILYKLLDLMLLVAGLGLLFGLWRRRHNARELSLGWGLLAVGWSVIILTALIRWTRMTSGTQGRLLFPAISALSGLIFEGLAQWVSHRHRHVLAIALGTALFVWAALCPFVHIAPAYARPPLLDLADIPDEARSVRITYGGKLELVAYSLDRTSVAPGETFHATAYWRCIMSLDRDYSIFVHLFGREEQDIGQANTYPGGGTYPTSLWRAGDVILDTYPVTVSPDAVTPTLARVEIGLHLLNAASRPLPMVDGQGRPLDSPIVGRIRVASPTPVHYDISHPTSFAFGEQIVLSGYDLDREETRTGGLLDLVLYWEALEQPREDYTVFVHLWNKGVMAGQHDSQPAGGGYPTSAWMPGEIVQDAHSIQIRPEAPAGRYQLIIGLYLLEENERLPLETGEDHLVLDQITVPW